MCLQQCGIIIYTIKTKQNLQQHEQIINNLLLKCIKRSDQISAKCSCSQKALRSSHLTNAEMLKSDMAQGEDANYTTLCVCVYVFFSTYKNNQKRLLKHQTFLMLLPTWSKLCFAIKSDKLFQLQTSVLDQEKKRGGVRVEKDISQAMSSLLGKDPCISCLFSVDWFSEQKKLIFSCSWLIKSIMVSNSKDYYATKRKKRRMVENKLWTYSNRIKNLSLRHCLIQ